MLEPTVSAASSIGVRVLAKTTLQVKIQKS